MVKRVIIAVLLVPVAEIVIFIVVAAVVGLVWALVLMLLTSLAGVLVLRRAGRGQVAKLRVAAAESNKSWLEKIWIEADTAGSLNLLAGLLLFLPGFLTDVLGAALLIRPLRRRLGSLFQRWLRRRDSGSRSVIDLAPSEWRRMPDPKIRRDARKRPDH